jgi:hypothetical protein
VGYYSVLYQGAGEGDAVESESPYGERDGGYRHDRGWDAQADAVAGSHSARGFAGRGPKGYQRSDERLREEVSDRLMADDRLDASEIEVQVENGEVTLTGTVEDRPAKRRAEDCAEQVMGVREVMSQLRVQARTGESRGAGQGMSVGTSGAPPRQPSSTQQPDADRSRSADVGSTGTNGRRKATSSR